MDNNKFKIKPKTNQLEFFGQLFAARDYAHLNHLQTNSYAQHIALNEFYAGILDVLDGIIEAYQGIYGIQKIVIPETSNYEGPVEYLKEFYDYIDKNRTMFSESWIQNEIDNIQKLVASTLYKLQFLK